MNNETNPLNGVIPKRKSNRESCILPKISVMFAGKVCGAK